MINGLSIDDWIFFRLGGGGGGSYGNFVFVNGLDLGK